MIRLGVALGLGLLACGVLAATQESREKKVGTWETSKGPEFVKLPAFPWQALSAPTAKKAGFWTSADGRLSRYSVHVDKAGIPDWIHAMADAQLGRGQDLDYEIELYPDGSEVYEIYRKVDGRERQLSARADRTVYYIGTEHEASRLPEAVSTAIQDLQGLTVQKCILKEGPTVSEYHLSATLNQASCRVRVSKDGQRIAVQRKIAAEVEVPLKP